jgi:redox-sensitive bicupin YhaK (pirin superfamily)
MTNIYHPASERGHVDFGWLDSHHSFSFGNWHDREKVHFGALRVLNDDVVKGGNGFDAHPHENVEIISIPLKGALAHKDSTGIEGILSTGDVQIMSIPERSEGYDRIRARSDGYDREGARNDAPTKVRQGTTPPEGLSGIGHAWYNASHFDPVNFLQIWIFPRQLNISPRHDQKTFPAQGRVDQWQTIVSPLPADNALWINQSARLALTRLSAGKTLRYDIIFPGNGVYVFVLSGNVEIGDSQLQSRDGLGITDADHFSVHATTNAEVLAIEVPMFA